MKGKLSWSIFWALIGIFIVIASVLFIPALRELFRSILYIFVPVSGAIFFLLGAVLLFLTVKGKVGGIFKKFLLLTGASAVGFFISVFLHNAFYALAIMTSHVAALSHTMEVFHVVFFIVAIFICPIGFLVGVIGSIVLAIKRSRMVE